MNRTEHPVHPPVSDGASDAVRPLDYFYADAGIALPPLDQIDPGDMPQPYQRMLVHENDMTPTLEAFYGRDIHLKVLKRRRQAGEYYRLVMLYLSGSNEPVEFGANRVLLQHYPPEARAVILAEVEPLGHIMRDFGVTHTCRPNAFLRVASDHTINDALGLQGAQVLYGRHNRLYDPQGRMISEVVEILRPVSKSMKQP